MSTINTSSTCSFPNIKDVGSGVANGTFGELLQGILEENNLDFLVTLPIKKASCATFYSIPTYDEVVILPCSKQKSKRLVETILKHFRFPAGGILEINSELPVGKGFASSSADLVAASRAVEDCFNIKMEHSLLEWFLSSIEPTDGVMYDGAVSYYHKEVRLREYIGKLPELCILSIDEGGTIDTVEFNKRIKPFSREEKLEYNFLLQKLTKAIRERDVHAIGLVSSRSAVLNQKILPKKYLPEVMKINEEIRGLGVVVAHSGTSLGIFLSKEEPDFHQKLELGYRYLSELNKEVHIYHT
ncbi:kinase [Paenibacillus thiaminolyticus]|uniref:Kinase n=1 Tax=Paenibacillus thiaminolyticus TaxID=49283 RepID=A0AAP9DQE2_PANTH|nr:kinase [Paenibacillus thiaminolyticus]MCY9538546.1 kinase [Paenibacillus thiaminolyticus]MCY9600600.1 kinase [Paenibacillus thiaminolyticus]MCY9608386.1 kinase [Paenibacillus thiaminolyticus]MCY9614795.1 kinase [Paenibacillus thiaminolyticus]MCY9619913.1 kinase [Paenibacillus thiaminolyticus]